MIGIGRGRAALWDWALILWELMLSLGKQSQNWIELKDTQLVSAAELLELLVCQWHGENLHIPGVRIASLLVQRNPHTFWRPDQRSQRCSMWIVLWRVESRKKVFFYVFTVASFFVKQTNEWRWHKNMEASDPLVMFPLPLLLLLLLFFFSDMFCMFTLMHSWPLFLDAGLNSLGNRCLQGFQNLPKCKWMIHIRATWDWSLHFECSTSHVEERSSASRLTISRK